MNKETAIKTMRELADAAQKEGILTLEDSVTVLSALGVISGLTEDKAKQVPQPESTPIKSSKPKKK